MHRLFAIQQELKAPKNQKNTFGGYKYRSCEDILEAVKPLLKKQSLGLFLKDEIVNVGERYYVKANAMIYDENGKILADISAYAREEENKKGMDASQITGAASSYARKYALNGLFAIDDTKDSDFTNTGDEKPAIKKKAKESGPEIDPDFDILQGLEACSAYSEFQAYYKANYPNAKDKEAFNIAATKKANQLKRKEVNNEN